MTKALRSVHILGVYSVEPSTEQFNEAVEILWGSGLTGAKLKEAQVNTREHYAGLYLIEVQLDPPVATVNFGDFCQQIEGRPQSDWQVAYDERAIDASTGIWAFFLHNVDLRKPLETPVGSLQLPTLSTKPAHLSSCVYEVP